MSLDCNIRLASSTLPEASTANGLYLCTKFESCDATKNKFMYELENCKELSALLQLLMLWNLQLCSGETGILATDEQS